MFRSAVVGESEIEIISCNRWIASAHRPDNNIAGGNVYIVISDVRVRHNKWHLNGRHTLFVHA